MKKAFLVVIDYEEKTEYLFSSVGVECSFENELYELKEKGHVISYEDVVAVELNGDIVEKVKEIIEIN